jgi:hypothetical protein
MERVQLRVRTPTVWCTYQLVSTWISQLIRRDSIDSTVNLRRMGWQLYSRVAVTSDSRDCPD